jgi:lysophospholipase L1-like esterase
MNVFAQLRGVAALAAAMLVLAAYAIQAGAAVPIPEICQVPAGLTADDSPLPRAAERLKQDKALKIVALGSSTTFGVGASKPSAAWPARLADALSKQFPAARITVVNLGRQRQSAQEMMERIADVIAEKPALVVWETGTSETVRHLEVEPFIATLLAGVDRMAGLGIDVMLIDTQYARSVERIINSQPYRDAIAQVAHMRNLVLFPRYDVMQWWVTNEKMSFESLSPAEATAAADRVYDCLGYLIAKSVVHALKAN